MLDMCKGVRQVVMLSRRCLLGKGGGEVGCDLHDCIDCLSRHVAPQLIVDADESRNSVLACYM